MDTNENKGMGGKFTRIPNALFERGSYLTVKAKLVYVALCSFRNNKTGATFPSYNKIKERSGLTRNEDITKAITELGQFGWLEKNRRFNKSNDYKLVIPVEVRPTKEDAKCWKSTTSRMRSDDFDKEIKNAKANSVSNAEQFDDEQSSGETNECYCNQESCYKCQIPF